MSNLLLTVSTEDLVNIVKALYYIGRIYQEVFRYRRESGGQASLAIKPPLRYKRYRTPLKAPTYARRAPLRVAKPVPNKELTSRVDQHQADLFRAAATSPQSWRSAAHGHLAVARMLYDAITTEVPEEPDLAALDKCQESYGLAIEALFKALAVHRGIIFVADNRLVIPDQFHDRRLAEMARLLGLQMSGFELEVLASIGLFLKGTLPRPMQAALRRKRPAPIGSGAVYPAQVLGTNFLLHMDAFASWIDQQLDTRDLALCSNARE